MADSALGGLGPRVDPVAYGSALHEDDGMMPILAGDGGLQSENETPPGAPGHLFEADSGQMMTFINDQMAVSSDDIVDLAFSDQALDQRHIDDARRLALAAANPADVFRIDFEKGSQAFHPLIEQCATMDKDERVALTLGNQRGSDHRFTKRGCRGKHAVVMTGKVPESSLLGWLQFSEESRLAR